MTGPFTEWTKWMPFNPSSIWTVLIKSNGYETASVFKSSNVGRARIPTTNFFCSLFFIISVFFFTRNSILIVSNAEGLRQLNLFTPDENISIFFSIFIRFQSVLYVTYRARTLQARRRDYSVKTSRPRR